MINDDYLKFVIPTVVGSPPNGIYNYDMFEVKKTLNKGLGVFATKDFTLEDTNKFLVYGGILFNEKQHQKYKKVTNDLKFDNKLCCSNPNLSHIAKFDDCYLNANPNLYNDKVKFGWIGSYVNEVSANSTQLYNSELIVLSPEDIILYESKIKQLPNCIDKNHIVGIRIKYALKKGDEVTVYYGDTYVRVNYTERTTQITRNEDGSLLAVNNNCNILTPRKK